MITLIFSLIITQTLLILILLLLMLRQSSSRHLHGFEKTVERLSRELKDDFYRGREESLLQAKQAREELSHALERATQGLSKSVMDIGTLQKNQLELFSKQLVTL